jgi:hypothetical protein
MRIILVTLISVSVLAACGESEDDTPPPPPQTVNTPFVNGQPTGQPVAPPGQVMVTVNANSNPPGATVTGGNRQLGVTPLTTQVPIPAPQPGQTQTFAFVFSLDGYQPATINTSPMNNVISITAALAPATQAVEVGGEGEGDTGAGGGREVTANGRGGGPIFDNHTTTGTAVVDESCVVDRLTVRLEGTHSYFQDLRITLRDPQGHSYTIQRSSRRNPFRSHVVRRASGRQARGTWNLAIADTLAQDSGVLRSWRLSMTCR